MQSTDQPPPHSQTLLQPEVVKVGIQIRTGDLSMWNNKHSPKLFMMHEFFDCARQVQQQLSRDLPPNAPYIWFLISDSMRVGPMLPRALWVPRRCTGCCSGSGVRVHIWRACTAQPCGPQALRSMSSCCQLCTVASWRSCAKLQSGTMARNC